MLKKLILNITVIMLSVSVFAQQKTDFSNKIFNFQFTYGYVNPAGNYAKIYGPHSSVGFGGMYKTRTNYMISFEGNFLFGSTIKETGIFNNIVTSGGFIAGSSGFPAEYSVAMRGWAGHITAGKLFPVNKFNKNHGFLISAGGGFLNHHIAIITQRNDVGPLTDEYKKGYDRNSTGLLLNEFIGYYFNSKNRFINFYGGLQFQQAFTKNMRGFNYDQMAYDTGVKTDLNYAFKFGWLIPIYMYTKDQDEFHFK